MPSAVDVIINAGSGASAKDDACEQIAQHFEAAGVDARISLARTGADILELARRAVRGDAATIVVGGGDGTIGAVASTLVGTDNRLGILPLGTFNHFAKDLKIPLDLAGAVRTISEGHSIQIDVGEVNNHIFLNNSSLGLYPSIVRHREQKQRLGHGKWPALIWAAFSVLRRYPFIDVRLNTDGKEFASRTPFVFIGNNEYEMESFNIGTRACLDAGHLSLYLSHRTGRLGILKLAMRALFKRLPQAGEFVALCATDVRIETRRRRVHVSMDGEVVVMQPPLQYRVRPGALRVIVPAPDVAVAE
ncbi:MAG TPA: diacylglycerol kinase family protein [Blastocatellia bacterium]|nr:diacylglycerol kinase family protein [Blastocatellia bacterium]